MTHFEHVTSTNTKGCNAGHATFRGCLNCGWEAPPCATEAQKEAAARYFAPKSTYPQVSKQ